MPPSPYCRARDSEIQIAVRGVSRLHALVLRNGLGRCILKDLGSANGTYVNGKRIAGEHVLKAGDRYLVPDDAERVNSDFDW